LTSIVVIVVQRRAARTQQRYRCANCPIYEAYAELESGRRRTRIARRARPFRRYESRRPLSVFVHEMREIR
jgi:hypothetical protein